MRILACWGTVVATTMLSGCGDGEHSPPPPSPSAPGVGTSSLTCSKQATTSDFASVVAAAVTGDTICLAAGDYGTWSGTSTAITLTATAGVTARMALDFDTGDQGVTIDGLTIDGSLMYNGVKDITVRNCVFTDHAVFDGVANANILFDHNNHLGVDTCESCWAGTLQLPYSSAVPSGVTISNSLIGESNADGIQTGAPVNIIGNEIRYVHEKGPDDPAHSDPIQIFGTGTVVRGNYIHHSADGIVAYDGIDHALIEDNVVDLVTGRWGMELYSDDSSVVRHNTMVYRTTCEFAPCGFISLDHKSADPAGHGTQIYDNIAYTVDLANGSTAARNDHNPSAIDVSYVGPQTSWSGYRLAPGSPLIGTASDGLDPGIVSY